MDSWSLIQNGMFEDALNAYSEEYRLTKSFSSLNNRAKASLLLKKYQDALSDFLTILRETDEFYRGDNQYIDIGIAYWLLEKYEEAHTFFIDSMTLKLRYTTNINIAPALVYFNGVYQNDLGTIKEAIKYLKKRRKNKIPLVNFLLDEINAVELLNSIDENSPLKEREFCKYEFYIAVKELHKGSKDQFYEHLKKCRDVKGNYLEFEYFLACGELDKRRL